MSEGESVAILISFNTKSEKFDSAYERNKFYRKLYGFKQVVKKEKKTYTYRKEGLLDEMPHMKIADSTFVIARDHINQIRRFFSDWEDKVMWKTLKVLLDEEEIEMLMEDGL